MTAPIPVETDRPDYVLDAVKKMLPDLQVARDVEAGYSTVRTASTAYLPQHPGEEAENYQIRLKRPAFFNAFARTTGGLTGMVYRRNPVLGDDVPATIRTEHWENIDNAGAHGDVFTKTVFHDALVAGHAGILVDYPKVEGRLTAGEEQARGLRPFWRHILKEHILSWRTALVDGKLVLTQLVLKEPTDVPDGAYGTKKVDRFRVLRQVQGVVTWEVFAIDTNGAAVSQSNGVMSLVREIPFVPIYANRTAFLQSKPTLMDLAWLVIAYYQTNSDKLHAEHIANTPVPLFVGVDTEDKIQLGVNTAITLPEGADGKWMETTGAAIGESRQTLAEMRTEMSVLGLGILERRPMTAETATAKRIDRSEKDSQLSAAARSLEDGIELALGYHAQFMGIADAQGHGGSVTLNRDYQELSLTPEQIRIYSDVVEKRQLSPETFWAILQEGNALPAQFNATAEMAQVQAMTVVPDMRGDPAVAGNV